MKLIYFLFALCLNALSAYSQIDIAIGSGTIGNSSTGYPCPLQDYYEGSRAQYLYKANELTAAGMTVGYINTVKFNVLSLNGFSGTIDGLSVRLKSTNISTLSTSLWESGTTTYIDQVDFVPVVGINTLTLSAPFFWNGVENILVEICNGSATSNYTENVTIPWTTGLPFNGSHTYRADNLGQLCNTINTTSTTTTTRPNIIFDYAPLSGCFFPKSIEITNTNPYSASAQWKSYPLGTTPIQFLWEARTSGIPGSGSAGLTTSGSTTDSSISITGLQPATNYKLYVRSVCSASDTSMWKGIDFATNCLPINVPYVQDFEYSTSLPICTKTQSFGGGNSWTLLNNPGSHFTNRALAVQSNWNYDTDSWFYTPDLHLNGGVTYQLTFKYGTNNGTQKLEVKYGKGATVNAMTKQLVDLQSINSGPAGHSIIDFTPTDTGNYNFGFHAYSGKNPNWLFLDNINVSKLPACKRFTAEAKISNISSTSATLQWNANNPAPTGYDIYYTTSATDVPIKTITPKMSVVDTVATLLALSPQTKYYCYLRATCGSNNSSPWAKAGNLLTLCSPVSIPYAVNFDSTFNLPACTDEMRINGGKKWVVKNDLYYFKSNALYAPTDNVDTWFFLRGIMMNAGTSYRLSFKYIDAFLGPNSREQLRVKYGTAMEVSAMDNLIVEYDSIHNGYFENSNTDFIPAVSGVYYIGFQAYSTANTGSLIGIDDIVVAETPVCDVPAKISLRSLTASQVVFSWSAPTITSPTRYHIYYSTATDFPADTVQPLLFPTDTTVTINGLAAATKYYFYIRSGCGTAGKSSWMKMGEHTTACGLETMPYKVDFQPGTTCLSFDNGIKGGEWFYSNYYAINGYSMKSQYGNENFPNNNWFFTGGITLTAGKSYRLKFLYAARSSNPCNLEVKYGIGANRSAMQNTIVNLPGLKSISSASSIIDFIPAVSGTYYFGFHDYSPPFGFYLTVDDIAISETPSCDIPVNIIKSDTTSNSIQLRWSKPVVGTPSTYELYYTTTDSIPDSTTAPVLIVSDTSAILSGLKSNTIYNYYIRTDCGGGDYSEWTSKDMFRTFCSATKLPFKDDFESSSSIPGCSVLKAGVGSSNWYISNNPGYGFTSKSLTYLYSSRPDAWYFTRKVKLTGGVSYRLKFRYGNNSTIYKEKLEVKMGFNYNALSMSTLLWKNDSIRFASAKKAQIDFTASTTGEYTVGFHAMSDPNQYRLFVDDIELIETPTCDVPENVNKSKITSSSFKLTWSPPLTGTPVNYAIYYSTADTFPIKATVPDTSITDTTLVLTGLQPATKYYFAVRAQCGGADKGLWTVLDSFVTSCLPTQVPYSINFEGSLNVPECTSIKNNGTGSSWKIINSPGFGFNSKTIFLQYNSVANANTWFFTRSIHLVGGTSYRLGFRYGTNYPSSAREKLRVKYGKIAEAAAMTNLILDYDSIRNLSATKSITDFTPSVTGDYVFGFYAYSSKSQGNLYLDDIYFQVSPDCDIPMNITQSGVSSSGIELSWMKPRTGAPVGYDIYYDTLNVRPTASAPPKLSVTDTIATLSGLSSATKYYYWLRTNCDTLGYSLWTGTKSFTTDVSRSMYYANTGQKSMEIGSTLGMEIKNLYPNPVTNWLNVDLVSPGSEKINLQLIDVTGRIVLTEQRQVNRGEQNMVINVSNLSEGTYLLKILCKMGCDKTIFKFRKR